MNLITVTNGCTYFLGHKKIVFIDEIRACNIINKVFEQKIYTCVFNFSKEHSWYEFYLNIKIEFTAKELEGK